MNRHIKIVLLSLWCVISAPGCVGAPLSAAELAVRRVTDTTREYSDFATGLIRYNPAGCECPDFELLLGERWHRVEITNDGRDEPATAIFSESLDTGSGFKCWIRGEIEGVLKKRYRSPVIRLRIESRCGSDGCDSPEDEKNPGQDEHT